MLQRSLILSILLFFSVANAADIQIVSVSGGSYTETDESGAISLYGGMAGTCASPSSTSTCNTCTSTSTPAVGCNPASINSTLRIGIAISVGTAVSNRAIKVYTGIGTNFDNAIQIGTNGTITAAASSTVTVPVTVTWGNVCDVDANFDSACNPSSTPTTGLSFESGRRIFVGIDANGDGMDSSEVTSFPIYLHHIDVTQTAISNQAVCSSPDSSKYGACGFSLDVGGDEKLYLRDVILSSSTPVVPSGAPAWYGLAFFSQDQTGQALNPANVSTGARSPIIKAYDTTDYSIDAVLNGFTNYQDYCLVMGNINKSQNIFYITTGGTSAENCGTPSEVVGLLDDKHCFISTAAFGSNMAQEVETFRQFRNHFLIPYNFGRDFVKAYYKYSPPMADFISQSEVLKFGVRMMLYPLYFFSVLCLKFGFMYAFLALVMTVLFLRQLKFFVQIWKSFGLSNRNRIGMFLVLFSMAFLLQTKAYAQLFPDKKKVQHTGAQADGLVQIDQDGVYIYKHTPQNAKQASHLRVGTVSNPDVESEVCNENNQCQAINFNDIYSGASGMGFEYMYEYFLFTDSGANFGKFGLQGGLSISAAQGHGRLVSNLNTESIESYTFVTAPFFAGGVYRFEYRDRQILVPYFGGGGVYAILAEKREDKSNIKGIGAPGFYGFGGALLNISALDRDLGSDFESEYDIKNLWLSAEYKFISVQSDAFSLENGYVQAGIGFDF